MSITKHKQRQQERPSKLVAIHGYWQNDKPEGLGVNFNFDTVGEEGVRTAAEQLAIALVESDKIAAREGAAKLAAEYIEQLQYFATIKETFTPGQAVVALGNIHWLEQRGLIPIDNFTGILFVRES